MNVLTRSRVALLVAVALASIAACGGTAPSASVGATGVAAPSAATSAASAPTVSATGTGTGNAATLAPSAAGTAPADAGSQELAATLPTEVAGQQLAVSAGAPLLTNNPGFAALLAELGKQPADVSSATATNGPAGASSVLIVALRVQGVDAAATFEGIRAVARRNNPNRVYTDQTIGGKQVITYRDPNAPETAIHRAGNTLYILSAFQRPAIEDALTKLP